MLIFSKSSHLVHYAWCDLAVGMDYFYFFHINKLEQWKDWAISLNSDTTEKYTVQYSTKPHIFKYFIESLAWLK